MQEREEVEGGAGKIELGRDGAYGIRKVVRILGRQALPSVVPSVRQSVSPPVRLSHRWPSRSPAVRWPSIGSSGLCCCHPTSAASPTPAHGVIGPCSIPRLVI